MKTKVFAPLVLVAGLLLFAFNLATPSVSTLKSEAIEFSLQKAYSFDVVETPTIMMAQLDTATSSPSVGSGNIWDIVKSNWVALLMSFLALVEIIIRATPSVSDNSIFNLLKKVLDAILPNKAKSGGVHI